MNDQSQHREKFSGYSRPNYTPVPDQLFDEQLPDLSGAELKVVLYIIRRTFGFKKDNDNISLNQLLHGIITRAGVQLDRGTGLSRSTLIEAIKGLIQKGHIIAEQRVSRERGNEATNYRLNILPVTPRSKIEPGESGDHTGLVRKSDPQETALQKGNTYLRSGNKHASSHDKDRGDFQPSPPKSIRSHTGMTPIGTVIKRGWRHLQRAGPSATSDTPRLHAAIAEISSEFGDTLHLRSNVSQARHLLVRTGLPEEVFVVRLYEARAITRDQSKVQGSGSAPRRRMPYMFAVLLDLLGLLDRSATKDG